MMKREAKLPEARELICFLAHWLSLPSGARSLVLNEAASQKKLDWWKRKILENSYDLNALIRLTKRFARQLELTLNEKAVLGAIIRQIEEERREKILEFLRHF